MCAVQGRPVADRQCVVFDLDGTLLAADSSTLAAELRRALELEDVEVVASASATHRWRLPRAVRARGEDELTALTRAGVALPVHHAYADSATGLSLLRAARTAHLVRPRDRHLPLLLRELGHDVEVLR